MAFRSRDILIKISDGLSPGTFTTIGGVRSKAITVNNETTDITTKDDAGWRKLLSDTGIRSISVSGGGVFKDDSAINALENLAYTGDVQEFQLIFPNGDGIQGTFLVPSFEQAGEHNDLQMYSITLEGTGVDPDAGITGGMTFIRDLVDPVDPAPEEPTPEFSVSASNFDGTNDYLTSSAFAAQPDHASGIMSMWINMNGGNSLTQRFWYTGSGFGELRRGTDNALHLTLLDNTATTVLRIFSTGTIIDTDGWVHALMSWNCVGGSLAAHMYFDDVDVLSTTTLIAGVSDWSRDPHTIGATDTGGSKLDACLSELYFNMDEYLDFSIAANRLKFRDALGAPVDLGADGSTPTGTAPAIYLPNPFGTFQTNAGSGGDFTVVGALAACATTP